MRWSWILLAFAFFLPSASAANHYIRAGSSGDGSDWSKAWGSFASVTWTRGDTYYVASGTYPEHVIVSRALSGSLWIYIKKATIAGHGTDMGWNTSYALGQAVIAGQWEFYVGYMDLDGVTGSGDSGHGIKIDCSGMGTSGSGLSIASGQSYINLSHIEIQMSGPSSGLSQDGVYCNSTAPVTNHHYSYLYIHDVPRNGLTWTGHAGNCVLEYCYFYRVMSLVPTIHGQTIQLSNAPMSGIEIRYNIAIDTAGTAFVAMLGSSGLNYSDIHIYDNIIWTSDKVTYTFSPGGVYGAAATNQVNILVYNNTWYNVRNANSWLAGSSVSGNEQRNNVYVNCYHQYPNLGTTSTNNFYYGPTGGNIPSGEVGQVNGTRMPVISPPSDFRLTSNSEAIGKGIPLGSQYAQDFAGIIRPLGSAWDIGAFAASGISISPPANLRIVP